MSKADLSPEALVKDFGIKLLNELPRHEWPEGHRTVFEAIERLKTFKYDTYAVQGDHIAEEQPWKYHTKARTQKLVSQARDCGQRGEATWRYACEHIVMNQFSAEVACKKCRGRVWRSEVEAQKHPDDETASVLAERQSKRRPCCCPPGTRPPDEEHMRGLNELFIYRVDERITHSNQVIQKALPKQRPDLVYGLRMTESLEKMLKTTLDDGRAVHEAIQVQPCPQRGERLLFPFMVVEAKGSNTDDWQQIFHQTALPIYTFLNLQRSLISATGTKSQWKSGPLVWFFMTRGDEWRLYLAYQDERILISLSDSEPQYATNVALIWKGSVVEYNEALQLILIVDYMADWARDAYRRDVLNELKILGSFESNMSVYSDRFSNRGSIPPRDLILWADPDVETQARERGLFDSFRDLSSNLGAIRQVCMIMSRFLSIHVTADNLKIFLDSIGEVRSKHREDFARAMLGQFPRSSLTPFLSAMQLREMENLWTGSSKIPAFLEQEGIKFYTNVQLIYYLSSSWDQVRDLTVLAFTEDAFIQLIKESNLKEGRKNAQLPRGNEESQLVA